MTVITSLGEEGKQLYVLSVQLFVYFARVNFCHFSLPLGVRGWLWLVIVALPWFFFDWQSIWKMKTPKHNLYVWIFLVQECEDVRRKYIDKEQGKTKHETPRFRFPSFIADLSNLDWKHRTRWKPSNEHAQAPTLLYCRTWIITINQKLYESCGINHTVQRNNRFNIWCSLNRLPCN